MILHEVQGSQDSQHRPSTHLPHRLLARLLAPIAVLTILLQSIPLEGLAAIGIIPLQQIKEQSRQDPLTSQLTKEKLTAAVEASNKYFFSQYRSMFNPNGPEASANCGPACLAMAMKHFGLLKADMDPQEAIDEARLLMTGKIKNKKNTDLGNVVRGARNLGLKARIVRRMRDIDAALDQGALIVLSGSPSTGTSYGGRLYYRHCRDGHFILITQRVGDVYIMNDPESPSGAHPIFRDELVGFKHYYPPSSVLHGAIAVSH